MAILANQVTMFSPGKQRRHAPPQLAGLRSAIDAGDASGIAEGDVFARVRKTLNLSKRR